MRPNNDLERRRSFYTAARSLADRGSALRKRFEGMSDEQIATEATKAPELFELYQLTDALLREITETLFAFTGEEPPAWEDEARRIYREKGKLAAAKFVRGYVGSLVLAKQFIEEKL